MSFHLAYHDTFRGRSKSWPDTQNIPKEKAPMAVPDYQPELEPSGRSMMNMKDKFRLMELVRDEYSSRNQSDNDFAAYAREKIGCRVTGNNVAGARIAFGIPSSREVAALQNPDMLVKRVEELERKNIQLERAILILANKMIGHSDITLAEILKVAP